MDALVSPPPEADFFAFSHRKYAISGVGWGGDTFRGLDTRVSPRGTGWPRECFVVVGRIFIRWCTCNIFAMLFLVTIQCLLLAHCAALGATPVPRSVRLRALSRTPPCMMGRAEKRMAMKRAKKGTSVPRPGGRPAVVGAPQQRNDVLADTVYGGGPGRVDTRSGDHLLLSV